VKLRSDITDFIILQDGRQRITFETKDDFRAEYDRLKDKKIVIEPKVYRKPRSLDANAYFHVLVNKIAAVLRSSDDEVKAELVVRYGTVERDEDGGPIGIMLPAKADPWKIYPYTRRYKSVVQDGRTYHCYLIYKHTHDMDSAEMSRLIDGAVSEAKELGIETMPPDELKALEALWKGETPHEQQREHE